MIIELNGLAGVGKLTIGRVLADAMHGRLIDNHTLYNPAFATTDFRSAAFYETVRAVRDLAFDRAALLPPETAIVLTIAPGTNGAWGEEWQRAIRALADRRGDALLGVHLHCSVEEGARRMSDPSRALLRKLTDSSVLGDGIDRPVRLDHCDARLDLDVTRLAPDEAAKAIASWAAKPGS
jgi:hypothetical protein